MLLGAYALWGGNLCTKKTKVVRRVIYLWGGVEMITEGQIASKKVYETLETFETFLRLLRLLRLF